MARDHAWFELTTIGAIYLGAFSLLTLWFLEITSLSDVSLLKEYPEYVIALGVPASYVIGSTVTRVLTVLFEYLGDYLPGPVLSVIRGERVHGLARDTGHERRAMVLHRGSDDLVREYNGLWRALTLFRSMIFATTTLVWSFVIWSSATPLEEHHPIVLAIWVFVVATLLVAHRGHSSIYYKFSRAALDEVGGEDDHRFENRDTGNPPAKT